jgi:hypothetical protein
MVQQQAPVPDDPHGGLGSYFTRRARRVAESLVPTAAERCYGE